jgi:hypothetical protein
MKSLTLVKLRVKSVPLMRWGKLMELVQLVLTVVYEQRKRQVAWRLPPPLSHLPPPPKIPLLRLPQVLLLLYIKLKAP